MNILVVGSGGREHTICWKLNQSEKSDKIFCAPGNAGMALDFECVDIGVEDYDALLAFAKKNNCELTVVGPEVPLCGGITDKFHAEGLKVFGPTKAAAELEGSKTFAKEFMNKYNIPTADSADFTDQKSAEEYVNKQFESDISGLVVKADGLAAGKGVIVAFDKQTALDGVALCFEGSFGNAGYKVLIEELLIGEEASILALTDGKTIISLASSQDHKRLLEDDLGPNTGGMGAYSPAPVVDDALMAIIQEQVLDNFLVGIQKENLDFRGIIYAGIMVTKTGIKVLEFNVRFGDPETQAVLMRLESDLVDIMNKTAEQTLDKVTLKWNANPAVCIVMASGGYPGSYEKGYAISGLENANNENAFVFHAGTSTNDKKEIVNTGGRVLGITAKGANIKTAVANAYEAVNKISWKDAIYRKDIAYRAIDRIK